jgi:hypothetical protein
MHFRRNNDILIGEDTRSSSVELSCRRVKIVASAPYISRAVVCSPSNAIGEDTINIQFIVFSTFGSNIQRLDKLANHRVFDYRGEGTTK